MRTSRSTAGKLAHAIVQGTAGAQLVATANGNNRLDGVTLEADLDLSANYAHVGIENGLTLNSTANVAGWRR